MKGEHLHLLASIVDGADVWSRFRLSEDLPIWAQAMVALLFVATLGLLFVEVKKQRERSFLIFASGTLAAAVLSLAVLRPAKLTEQGRSVPGVVVALSDSSHRLDLPVNEELSRRRVAHQAVEKLNSAFSKARLVQREFDEKLLAVGESRSDVSGSDLMQALHELQSGEGERPRSIVLLSDGRMTRPGEVAKKDWKESLLVAAAGIPIHTVATAEAELDDRSLRSVGMTGSAVAHQPFRLALEVGCSGQTNCASVEVVVRELLEGQAPTELARGQASGDKAGARLSLEITLEQAGDRALEVELVSENEDAVPANDKRIIPLFVRRDRLRMLHVAGRPTYDVRALRMFLKSDESIDLISFFILRTESDQVQASQDDLALIPFPVDELFSEHLRSFDAIILQDIDAPRYRLDRHFRALKDYVLRGGGLILVGGPTGFSSGGYALSPVADVLPVELPRDGELIVRKPFIPQYTEVGRVAPMLKALRSTMGESLPEMSGANAFASAKENALVLWEHPELSPAGITGASRMPILALGESGDGRSIAISVDSTHRLRFGEAGARTGGRAYADLWEGLLGWLMRDPRFESAQLKLQGPCISGRDQVLIVEPLPGAPDDVSVSLERLGSLTADARTLERMEAGANGELRFLARNLPEGGYAARVKVGAAPPTRTVIACEEGGEAWADSRPDIARLKAIAEATGGQFRGADSISELPEPASTFVSAHRESRAILAPWLWALLAVVFSSIHWLVRRMVGYV